MAFQNSPPNFQRIWVDDFLEFLQQFLKVRNAVDCNKTVKSPLLTFLAINKDGWDGCCKM